VLAAPKPAVIMKQGLVRIRRRAEARAQVRVAAGDFRDRGMSEPS